jgi:hypothetical protein
MDPSFSVLPESGSRDDYVDVDYVAPIEVHVATFMGCMCVLMVCSV